jgi:negative regulator of flagellin synthesis FlgM
MRISGTPGLPGTTSLQATVETAPAGSSAAPAAAGAPAEMQSAVMQPARAALKSLPDVDTARVAELRDALARGELPFDASKLAGLIRRFHGGRG